MKSRQNVWLLDELRGHAFDDFLCNSGWGKAKSRKGLDLRTKFSGHVNLNIPLVSANMDTITGARMAIAQAKEGGIGVIHRYLSIEDHCQKVREVKREESFIISKPYSVQQISTVREAERIMTKNNVGSLVVLNEDGVLEGILTSRDIRFCSDKDIPVSRRMNGRGTLVTALIDIQLEEARKILDENRLEKLPLIDDRGHLVGLITSKDIENLEKYPLANKDCNGQLIVGAAIGATGDYLERASELIKAGVDVIVIDIANAQSDIGLDATRAFRKKFPEMELVVGNIAIGMAVSKYYGLNVNGFKVGLGPGSACTTRYQTNIGVTQAYAVYDCSWTSEVPIIADGGIRRDGHIFLSLMLGGSSVMIGGLFGGTDEAPGHVIRNSKGNKVKKFRGMASREAMLEKLVSEFADDPYETLSRISPEGIEQELEYKDSVVPIIHDMMNHLASSISYMGAKSLKEAQEMFMANPQKYLTKVSRAAQIESWRRDV